MQESNQMPPAQPNMDDEIDLRQYLDVLIAWRWEILAIMVLATLVAAGVVLIQRAVTPPVYSATATLAIARTGRDIQFDENFRTTLDAENPANTRRIALVGLVASNAVAEVVAKGLSDAFDEKERAPIQLIKQIEAAAVTAPGSRTEGDLIQITARAGEPEKAAELATTWAKVYVEYANRLYGDVPVQLIESVQNELAQAQVAYDSTQAKLESFLSANGVSSLERRITEKTNLIDSLQQNQLQVMQAYIEQQIAAVKQVADALLKQEIEAKTAAFEQEVAATKKVFSAALEQELRSAETVYNTALEQELTAKTAVFEQELAAAKTVFDAALQQEVTAAETVYNTALRQELESTQTVLQTALDLELDSTRTLVNTALQQELAAAQKVLNTSLDQELAARRAFVPRPWAHALWNRMARRRASSGVTERRGSCARSTPPPRGTWACGRHSPAPFEARAPSLERSSGRRPCSPSSTARSWCRSARCAASKACPTCSSAIRASARWPRPWPTGRAHGQVRPPRWPRSAPASAEASRTCTPQAWCTGTCRLARSGLAPRGARGSSTCDERELAASPTTCPT